MKLIANNHYEFTHACLFAGAGGLSLGLNQGHARIGVAQATMRCLGGIDAWPAAVESFGRITGTPGTQLDLFERADYMAFHGKEPPKDWREATPADIRAAFGGVFPDILASSPPCKGLSSLQTAERAASDKYQALNRLVVRGLALSLEAFKDDPPALVLLENVPRIETRGKLLLDELKALLRGYGYAVAGFAHDCGELGGLGQHRNRYLLVGRHTGKVQPFLYQPPKRRVRSIGEVIGHLPPPDSPEMGPMHRLPRLEWQTWVRLALIPAGKDWRALHELAVQDGYLRDLCIVPEGTAWHGGVYGVQRWDEASGVVKGRSGPSTGAHAVADPRLNCDATDKRGRRHNNVYRIAWWEDACPAVTAGNGPAGGGLSVADPRMQQGALGQHAGKMSVGLFEAPARTVAGTVDIQAGAQSIADPQLFKTKIGGEHWQGGGHYGVADWQGPSATVAANAKLDTGRFSVADPRTLPGPHDVLDPPPIIIALDGTWHRPLTTLELALLQGYPLHVLDGSLLSFAGRSDAVWREQIGNSVPPPAARAIADEMARTLLLQQLGQTFELTSAPIWVQPFAAAVSLAGVM